MRVRMVQAMYSPTPGVRVCVHTVHVVVPPVIQPIRERHRELSIVPALVQTVQDVQRHTGDDQPEYRLRAPLYAQLRHDHLPATIDHRPCPVPGAAPPSVKGTPLDRSRV